MGRITACRPRMIPFRGLAQDRSGSRHPDRTSREDEDAPLACHLASVTTHWCAWGSASTGSMTNTRRWFEASHRFSPPHILSILSKSRTPCTVVLSNLKVKNSRSIGIRSFYGCGYFMSCREWPSNVSPDGSAMTSARPQEVTPLDLLCGVPRPIYLLLVDYRIRNVKAGTACGFSLNLSRIG